MADSFPVSPPFEEDVLSTSRTGWQLLADPLLNKGTAFTEAERDVFGLHGQLPPHVGTLDEQAARRMAVLRRFASDLERYAFLRELHDNNETLFFAVLERGAKALAAASPAASDPTANLLPPVTALREVAFAVAPATAMRAHREGLTCGIETHEIKAAIRAKMWLPRYCRYQPAR